MQEKKHPEKLKPLPELERSVTEILVAQGRSFEPFVKTFSYSGENVTKFSLGTLVGVFEVDEKSEDSAYIVNFLASVAKKEYFSNSRRGAVESFEASLHKINLALAELVKHGNVAWLGKFHGALGIFERNNFHFSATGEAKIMLFRGESLNDIADGLASEESHIHPIKTFIEVSSGRLMPGDKVILSAPELFRLFSFEDLRKNAFRMDEERFKQFLKTALVNELDMTGAIVADIKEALMPVAEKPASRERKTETESQKTIKNVFSQAAFVPEKKEGSIEESLTQKEPPLSSEYIDSKTGHIYIQGDAPEEPSSHPFLDRLSGWAQDTGLALRAAATAQGRWLRKARKQSVIALDTISKEAKIAGHRTFRTLRKQWRKSMAKKVTPVEIPREEPAPAEPVAATPIAPVKKMVTDIPMTRPKEEAAPSMSEAPAVIETPPQEIEVSVASDPTAESETPLAQEDDIPPFIKAKLAAFYNKSTATIEDEPPIVSSSETTSPDYRQRVSETLTVVSEKTKRGTLIIWSHTKRWWGFGGQTAKTIAENSAAFYGKLAPANKKIVIGSVVALLLIVSLAGALIFKYRASAPSVASDPTAESDDSTKTLFAQEEKNAHETTPTAIITENIRPLSATLLDDAVFLISRNSIVDVRENKHYPLPSGSGVPTFISAMEDLRLIFVYTDQNELFAWSPISHTFVKNTLDLPAGAKVQSIGTYLTYLYVLDGAANQIYRFPRADGGFGAPTNWLRDSTTLSENALMAVNETLFVAPDNTSISAFFRGRFVRTLEAPHAPLSVTSLYTHPGLTHIYALDREHKRILMWNQDGNLSAQYFNEKIAEATSLTVNAKETEIFFTTENGLFSIKR